MIVTIVLFCAVIMNKLFEKRFHNLSVAAFTSQDEVAVPASVLKCRSSSLATRVCNFEWENLEVNVGTSSDQLVDDVRVPLLASQGEGGEALLSHTVGVKYQ